jgi:hypothetical protein
MIYEFAVDPDLLSSWDKFQRIISLFGVTKGRLISRFPKRWERLVYDSVASGNTERTRIEIALKRIQRELLLPRKHSWNDRDFWIDNAKAEHARTPFRAVLTTTADPTFTFLIDATDLDHTALPELLKAGPSRIVLRTADEIGLSVRPLFLLSKHIVIVEPNFTINSPKFLGPWASIMRSLLDTQGNLRADLVIELHLGADKLSEFVNPQSSLNAKLGPHIPAGNRITVVSWPKEDVHNRYILTDLAGIQLGEGLGLPDSLSSRNDDSLCFTDRDTTTLLLAKYQQVTYHQVRYVVNGAMRI